MNEKFFELSLEKQQSILNAGFEVFGKNDYKKASTEQIAITAGISKGLLFYYFHNKKEFYLYLYKVALKLVQDNIVNSEFNEITDFFELLEYSARKKYALLQNNPYLFEFVTRAFYSQKEEVSAALNQKMQEETASLYSKYFLNIDFSKFKPDIVPEELVRMFTWMADGCLHEIQRTGEPLDMNNLMDKYEKWTELFKKMSYKEEYLQ